jgi:hypothetical protein
MDVPGDADRWTRWLDRASISSFRRFGRHEAGELDDLIG